MEQIIVNGLYLGAQYALIALGLTLIFALMNVLNFAHGQMYVLGGYVTFLIYGYFELPFVLGLFASALTLLAVGACGGKILVPTGAQEKLARRKHDVAGGGVGLFL